jgi:hypothetical protein
MLLTKYLYTGTLSHSSVCIDKYCSVSRFTLSNDDYMVTQRTYSYSIVYRRRSKSFRIYQSKSEYQKYDT